MAWRAAKKMTSSVPSWKAELQRKKREKSNKDSEKGKVPWKNEFNETVNVIIISANEIDPDKEEVDPLGNNHQDGSSPEPSKNSTNGVSEEHVASVRNNPFLKFDQMISSKGSNDSPRPKYLRRQSSGSLTQSFDKDSPEEEPPSNLKSRSKSVDNLNFQLENHMQSDQSGNDTTKDRGQGKGIIASLRAKFGKAASSDEYKAIVKRPRSKSQTLSDATEAENSSQNTSSRRLAGSSKSESKQEVSKPTVKETGHVKPRDKADVTKGSDPIPSVIDKGLDITPPGHQSLSNREVQSKPAEEPKLTIQPPEAKEIHPVPTETQLVKKKPSNLSASALIKLSNDDDETSPSRTLKRPPSIVDGGEDFHSVASRPEGDAETREGKDETDSVGKRSSSAIIHRYETQAKADVTTPGLVSNNITNDIDAPKGPVSESNKSAQKDPPKKPTILKEKPQLGNRTNTSHNLTKKENKRDDGIKVTTITNTSGNSSTKPAETVKKTTITNVENIQSKEELKKAPAEQEKAKFTPSGSSSSKVNLIPGADRQVHSTVRSQSSVPVNSSHEQEEQRASPFPIKLRKVEKPSSAGVKIVRSTKGKEVNQRKEKQDVQTRLKQQVNGEIPVTNIDDIELNETEEKRDPVVIDRAKFGVIGYNTPTNCPSMLKGTRKAKSKFRIRFNDNRNQIHEYLSEDSALKEYVAEHGYEPEEEIVRENGNEEEEDEDDVDEETKKKTMNNNTSLFAEGLQNITRSNNTDLSAFLGRGPHKKEPSRTASRPHPVSVTPTEPEPELVATPLDSGDGFSMGSSSAMLF
ncbi:uncharacterized protein [Apostichopus japonicus]|uniref:uncharacterized protein isoform X2 n=1 Tax=Stichopus japonicus TaxID=307972 RepID=UPI003AB7FA15